MTDLCACKMRLPARRPQTDAGDERKRDSQFSNLPHPACLGADVHWARTKGPHPGVIALSIFELLFQQTQIPLPIHLTRTVLLGDTAQGENAELRTPRGVESSHTMMPSLAKKQVAPAALSISNSENVAVAISHPPDDVNYYGTYDADLSYPYISIHYDFNRAYYHNHDYTYLNSASEVGRGSRGSKRRRMATPSSSSNLRLSDLPDALLTAVAVFLEKTSVALFAVAISKSDSGQPPTMREAIVASCAGRPSEGPWEVIDFLDIEKSLRDRLTDDDLACILACVDAARNLKKLKLTHCIQVTGLGLEPIRRSVVLEQLDLSQVGQHELPYTTGPMGLICEETVLPILNSIIDSNGALKHLQFPEKWIGGASGAFQTFLEKFDAFLSRREICCLVCADICRDGMIRTYAGHYYGLQMRTCYSCGGSVCESCEDEVDVCVQCKKVYCVSCNPVMYCEMCGNQSCCGCGLVNNYCDECDMQYCDFCNH